MKISPLDSTENSASKEIQPEQTEDKEKVEFVDTQIETNENPFTESEEPQYNETSRALNKQDAIQKTIENLRKSTSIGIAHEVRELNLFQTVLSHLLPFVLFALLRLIFYLGNMKIACRVDKREGDTIDGTKNVCDSEEENFGVVISNYFFAAAPMLYNYYVNLWNYLSRRFFIVLYGLITPILSILVVYANYWLTESRYIRLWNFALYSVQFVMVLFVCRNLKQSYSKVIAPLFVMVTIISVWLFSLLAMPMVFESDQNSTLLFFPLSLTILNVVIINLIELVRPVEQFSQHQIYFFCAAYTVVIDTSRFALFLFTHKDTPEYFRRMSFALFLSTIFEIITRTAIDDVIKCWLLNHCASCFYRRNSNQKLWVLKGRTRIIKIFYGTRYSLPYYPLAIFITLKMFGWVPRNAVNWIDFSVFIQVVSPSIIRHPSQ